MPRQYPTAVSAYVGSSSETEAKVLKMFNKQTSERWRLGTINVTNGKAKTPLDVSVKFDVQQGK